MTTQQITKETATTVAELIANLNKIRERYGANTLIIANIINEAGPVYITTSYDPVSKTAIIETLEE